MMKKKGYARGGAKMKKMRAGGAKMAMKKKGMARGGTKKMMGGGTMKKKGYARGGTARRK